MEDAHQNHFVILPDPLVASSHRKYGSRGVPELMGVSPDGGPKWGGLQILSYLILSMSVLACDVSEGLT